MRGPPPQMGAFCQRSRPALRACEVDLVRGGGSFLLCFVCSCPFTRAILFRANVSLLCTFAFKRTAPFSSFSRHCGGQTWHLHNPACYLRSFFFRRSSARWRGGRSTKPPLYLYTFTFGQDHLVNPVNLGEIVHRCCSCAPLSSCGSLLSSLCIKEENIKWKGNAPWWF